MEDKIFNAWQRAETNPVRVFGASDVDFLQGERCKIEWRVSNELDNQRKRFGFLESRDEHT